MRKNERGAVFVQVAVCLLAVLAIAGVVIDYGVMWVARAQVQTSADAAVLAGIQSLTFDTPTNLSQTKLIAQQVGLRNKVWGQAPDIQLTDVTFPNCPPTLNWSTTETCIQVEAFRNQARGNALPTFFANLVGVSAQGVRAVAVGRAVAGNSTNCLKPWAVGDKWLESSGPWAQTSTYTPPGDSYTPPSSTDPGTGFTEKDGAGNPTYYGYQMVLKLANPGQGANEIPINSAGWAMELALNNDASSNPASTPAYSANISGCTSDTVSISPYGSTCTSVDPTKGCLAIKTGSTGAINSKAIGDFIDANDPGASWVDGSGTDGWKTGYVTGATRTPSSRIVPIALFSVPEYLEAGYNGSNGIVRIVNIMGFFVEGTCQTVSFKETYLDCPNGGNAQSAIVGRMVNYPALAVSTAGNVVGSFGQVMVLVR